MRSLLLILAAAAAGVRAQSKGAKCEYIKDVKSQPDPLIGFTPGKATFPCDMMSPIKFGPVPKGCAKLEVIVARGTSEPGDFGTVVGDPLVARVKRDLPGGEARGYPVQVRAEFGILGVACASDGKDPDV
jgi:cutinase